MTHCFYFFWEGEEDDLDAGFDKSGFLELHAIPQHNEKGLGMPREGYDLHTDGGVAKDEQLPPWHLMAVLMPTVEVE